jgi:hypothetical protein
MANGESNGSDGTQTAGTTTTSAPATGTQAAGTQAAGTQATGTQATGTQAAGAPATGTQAASAPASDLYGAPANGYKAPDGVTFDEGLSTDLGDLGKQLNLSPKGMEHVYKLAAKHAASTQASIAKAHQDNLATWRGALESDAAVGGTKLAESKAVAAKAVEVFGSPELVTLLRESGISEHPLIFKMLYNAGKSIREDGFIRGDTNKGGGGGLLTYANSNHN